MMKRILISMLVLLGFAVDSWAQYVVVVSNPNAAGEVRVGKSLDLGAFAAGSNLIDDAESGGTVYFEFAPYSGYQFTGITYPEGLSSENVTNISGNLYSFTMPEDAVMLQFFINFEKIPEVVTGVNINEENFPDAKFRAWLLSQSYGKDAVITDAEMKGITKIMARGCGIKNLTGIQFFTELTELDVSNLEGTHPKEQWNSISTIDLSGNTKLRVLWADNNKIASINLSSCSDLRNLGINNNLLTALDVSQNAALTMLSCENNQLKAINVTNNQNIGVLSCKGNQLKALDLSKNLLLEQLYCENNQLAAIDVTNHSKLMLFNCNDNQLTTLDVTGCPELYQLYCYNNQISGQAMTTLVNSLRQSGGYTVVIDQDNESEQNEITKDQFAVAKAKGWSVEVKIGDDFFPFNRDEHDYVDLGLTSGTLWATCNVGAYRPQDIGLYFAWGDTTGYGTDVSDGYLFNWENYKWGEVISDNTYFTKYCSDSSRGKDGFTDDKVELDPEDDAASVNWGKQWRTPTYEQLTELKEECTWTPMTIGDINGYEVTGPNDNSIFLPETGWRIDELLNEGGAYWSRSTDPKNAGGAYYLGWDQWGSYMFGGRLDGQCIRPVFVNISGDANSDGEVNVADIVEIINYLDGSPSSRFNEKNADANGIDGVTIEDINAIVNIILGVE